MTKVAEVEPTRQRQKKGDIKRDEKQIQDAMGDIGRPWRTKSLLAGLEERKAITPQMRHAGELFHVFFYRAQLDPIKAADMGRVPRGAGSLSEREVRIEIARRKISDALRALGGGSSPAGCCAWYVLGCDMSLREWAIREGWCGRTVNPHVAQGMLIVTLGALSMHFGLDG